MYLLIFNPFLKSNFVAVILDHTLASRLSLEPGEETNFQQWSKQKGFMPLSKPILIVHTMVLNIIATISCFFKVIFHVSLKSWKILWRLRRKTCFENKTINLLELKHFRGTGPDSSRSWLN